MWKLAFDLQGRCAENEADGNSSEGCAAADSMKVECRHVGIVPAYVRAFHPVFGYPAARTSKKVDAGTWTYATFD